MPHAPERLTLEKVCELIKEFDYFGGEKLRISGGEPLCYEGLSVIIDACRGTNFETAIYTTGISSNGSSLMPLSDHMLDLVCESNIKIIFSLHGAREKTHDSLTQVEGSFDTTMSAMERALEAGASVEVHVVPTAINLNEIASMTRLLASMNIKKVSWLRFVPQGRGQLNRDMLQLSKERLKKLARMKTELQQVYQTITIRTGAPFNILCPESAVSCDAGLSVLTIRPDGSVAPCDAFKQFRTGDAFSNILHNSLAEVWNKSDFLNKVRKIYEYRLASPCSSCSLYSQCASGCLAQKAIAAGILTDGRDPECPLNGVEMRCVEVEAIPIC